MKFRNMYVAFPPFMLSKGLEGDPDLQFLLQGGDLLKVLSPSWKKTRFLQLQEDCKTMYRKSKKPFKSHQTCKCLGPSSPLTLLKTTNK